MSAENRLANQKSYYLLQHKDNPIDWYPWGPEALQKAKDENKPIFLSVGYSSCHWCHVMAHEAFSDLKTAKFMNENFVNIKVDREENPDIDNYYQKACMLFTGNGGWPLSAFLLPDARPYYAGTYFPKVRKQNMPSFLDVAQELKKVFKDDFAQADKNATQVTEHIAKGNVSEGKVQFQGHFPAPASILDALKQYQDQEWGSYGQAPKFPHFAFHEWAIEQMLEGMVQKEQGEFVIKTTELMLMGGLQDQARGGIHRYSTDQKWLVPHFEKMLYDQAGLLKVLSKLSLLYPTPMVYDSIINTLDYLRNEMTSEEKYFFSAQDADSEGFEGLYFCFSKEEFEDALNKHDDDQESLAKNRDKILKWFNITDTPNFEQGLNVISMNAQYKEEYFTPEGWDIVRKVRRALVNERKDRIPPMTDSKGIASWNYMLLSALVDVIQYCPLDVIKKMAGELLNHTLEGIHQHFVVQKDGQGIQLRHVSTHDSTLPFLEDFIMFAEAQLRLYELSANDVFKENFKETLKFITQEFLEKDHMLTRAKLANDFELYPNQRYNEFDSSFRSPVPTYVSLMRRASVLFMSRDYLDQISDITESLTHICLKNPLSSGEALRVLTYPQEVYRVIKVPRAFAREEKYQKFLSYFMPRFVFEYHDEGNIWQICSLKACEVQGEGLDHFIETLTQKNEG